jgi:threonine dehydratase
MNLHEQLSAEAIGAMAERLAPHVRRTPVLRVDGADFGLAGVRLAFKLEYLQRSGSFKIRGAFCNMLSREVPPAGVVAASGGNHGVAVAYAARQLNLPATVFVPAVAAQAKVEQIRALGADLQITGEHYADALAASEEFVQASGAMSIHAFDQVETLLGQGTVGYEFERDEPDLDSIFVAVGGGGLIGGMAAWYRGRTRLIGVEPDQAPTLAQALAAGAPVDAPVGGIAADSLGPRRVGALVFPIAQRWVERTALVSDDRIRAAQRALWNHLRIVVEPGGAAAFAAIMEGPERPAAGQTVGVLLCGANTGAVVFD